MTDSTILQAREAITNGRDWSVIVGKPTSIAGYGITNAYTKTEVDTLFTSAGFGAGTANKLAKWSDSDTLADSILSATADTLTLSGDAVFDQGADDGAILSLVSSDVAHGMTDFAPTDVYAVFAKNSPTAGGMLFRGLSSGNTAFNITANVAAANTTKTAGGAAGAVFFNGVLKSGTGGTSLGANGNILVLADNASRKFIFDASSRFDIVGAGSIFNNGAQVVSTRQTGWAAATGTATRTTFATGSVTTAQLAERVKALIDDLISHGLIGA